ncbi:hypothetical protein [Streptomyces sp. NBC_00439]|uniref:hypothetical protein n=1 Tax=unclassified Streptomyces TaxID=2593676 RepID=UPI0022573BDB|nr:hypothetical protein [Streptomyces sp. NBC_00439]MCX5103580.1 hypothetical protein [Streptomyces sp. NBC_00439]WSX06268.1 hypothetical protein OG355_40805 [Streptomyces sp. NBC_00987]
MRVLESVEDDRYDLREVTLASGGRELAYIWPYDEIRDEDCDAEQFMARHLQEFVARCGRIAPGLTAEADRWTGRRGVPGSDFGRDTRCHGPLPAVVASDT